MTRPPLHVKQRFHNMHEAEQAALRIFSTGFSAIVIGFALIIAMASNLPGIIALSLGFFVVVGGALWLFYVSEYQAESRTCSRCGKENKVFSDEKYFKCVSCGHVVVLRET